MQPSRWYALFPGKLHDSQPTSPVSRQDLGNLCRGKLFMTTGSVVHRHSLSLPAGLNRLHPLYRLRKSEERYSRRRLTNWWKRSCEPSNGSPEHWKPRTPPWADCGGCSSEPKLKRLAICCRKAPPPRTPPSLTRLGGLEGVPLRKCLQINGGIF